MSVSKSALETWFRCNRAYKYTYIDGYQGKEQSREQAFGIAGHARLETTLLGLEAGPAETLPDLDQCKLDVLLKHSTNQLPVEVRSVEFAWNLETLCHGVFDAVDVVGTNTNVWEHKFTTTDFSSEWNESYWEKLRTDWQTGLYQLAAKHIYGGDVQVIYNVYRIPALKPRKNEDLSDYAARLAEDIQADPSRYYQQARIKWTDQQLEVLRQDVLDAKFSMALLSMNNANYPRSRKCFEYKRRCEFYDTCFGGVPLAENSLLQPRTKR